MTSPPGSASTPRPSATTSAAGYSPPAPRTPAGYRTYQDSDLERISFIKTAQQLGIALDDIAQILAIRDRGEAPCDYLRALVQRNIEDIENRIAELQDMREQLMSIEHIARQLPERPGACPVIEHLRKDSHRT